MKSHVYLSTLLFRRPRDGDTLLLLPFGEVMGAAAEERVDFLEEREELAQEYRPSAREFNRDLFRSIVKSYKSAAGDSLLRAWYIRRERSWLPESDEREEHGLGAAISSALQRYLPPVTLEGGEAVEPDVYDGELEMSHRVPPKMWREAAAIGVTPSAASAFRTSLMYSSSVPRSRTDLRDYVERAFMSYAANVDEGATADPW